MIVMYITCLHFEDMHIDLAICDTPKIRRWLIMYILPKKAAQHLHCRILSLMVVKYWYPSHFG